MAHVMNIFGATSTAEPTTLQRRSEPHGLGLFDATLRQAMQTEQRQRPDREPGNQTAPVHEQRGERPHDNPVRRPSAKPTHEQADPVEQESAPPEAPAPVATEADTSSPAENEATAGNESTTNAQPETESDKSPAAETKNSGGNSATDAEQGASPAQDQQGTAKIIPPSSVASSSAAPSSVAPSSSGEQQTGPEHAQSVEQPIDIAAQDKNVQVSPAQGENTAPVLADHGVVTMTPTPANQAAGEVVPEPGDTASAVSPSSTQPAEQSAAVTPAPTETTTADQSFADQAGNQSDAQPMEQAGQPLEQQPVKTTPSESQAATTDGAENEHTASNPSTPRPENATRPEGEQIQTVKPELVETKPVEGQRETGGTVVDKPVIQEQTANGQTWSANSEQVAGENAARITVKPDSNMEATSSANKPAPVQRDEIPAEALSVEIERVQSSEKKPESQHQAQHETKPTVINQAAKPQPRIRADAAMETADAWAANKLVGPAIRQTATIKEIAETAEPPVAQEVPRVQTADNRPIAAETGEQETAAREESSSTGSDQQTSEQDEQAFQREFTAQTDRVQVTASQTGGRRQTSSGIPDFQAHLEPTLQEARSVEATSQARSNAAIEHAAREVMEKIEHWQDMVRKFDEHLLSLLKDGGREMRITLIPERLGRVVLSCYGDESDGVTIQLQAQNGAVRDLLQHHESGIRGMLEDHGFKLSQFSVSTSSDGADTDFLDQRADPRRFSKQHNQGTSSIGRAGSATTAEETEAAQPAPMQRPGREDGIWLVA